MKKSRILSSLILMIFSFCTFVTASVAWFSNFVEADSPEEFLGSSIAAYFADGDGSEADPYIISNANHLYNLAWLQNKNQFDSKKFYFKVCEIVGEGDNIQHIPTTIDMAGKIFGADEEGKSGAIPPIGTFEYPFKGYFDGFGSTITNLWVSTFEEDWKEHPEGSLPYDSDYVGLFGAISEEAIVEDFILDKVEIKSHIDATVGIVCGYVDAMVKDVGVYNGIINISDGAVCTSKYSLIGDKSSDITWADMPTLDVGGGEGEGGEGEGGKNGDLIIDPNDYRNGEANKFATINAGPNGYKAIEGAIPGTAYYVGTLTKISSGFSTKGIYNLTNYAETGNYTTFTADPDSRAQTEIAYFYSQYEKNKDVLISPGIPFNENGQVNAYTTVNDEYNTGLKLPQGGIWFKPQGSGTVSVVFSAQDKGAGRFAMLYACTRDSSGNLTVVNEKSKQFALPSDVLKNGQLAYYEFDAEKGYEYVIGQHSDGGAFGFMALALAGVDENYGEGGGDGGGVGDDMVDGQYYPVMFDLDYVVSPTTRPSSEGYENHQTLLSLNTTAAEGDNYIYYLAAGTDADTSRVYYFLPANAEITDISKDKESEKALSFDQTLPGGSTFSDRLTQ